MAKRIIAHIVVILALLTMGTHLMRNYGLSVGILPLVVGAAVLVLGHWTAVLVLQLMLLTFTAEWIRTTVTLYHQRQENSEDATRFLAIMISVTVLILVAAAIGQWCVRVAPKGESANSAG